MSYRQYTQCVQPSSFSGSPIGNAVAMGLFIALMDLVGGGLIAGLAGAPIGGLIVVTTALLAIVVPLLSFAHWWLYGRLVCLGGEQCAVGMVVSVEPPQTKSGFERFDSDYSANLLLPPHRIGDNQATIAADGFLGKLIKEQPGTKSRGLPFRDYTARSCDSDPATAVLHVEFEGAGMYILYQWLKAVVALLAVAAVGSWFCWIPIIGWIICAVAGAILGAALASLIAGIADALSDAAAPSDVDPALGGTLHTNGCQGRGADLLVVSGEWVYDSLHEGWNEIHPIRHCQRIGTWNGVWPFDAHDAQNRWCQAIASTHAPLTQDNQKKPENQWTVHPLIDGCQPEEEDNGAVPPVIR